jgi:hypothetical protein
MLRNNILLSTICITILGVILLGFISQSYAAGDFNITDYGAIADSATDNSPAITAAIDAAIAAGGGRVVFPASASEYLIQNTIRIEADNIELFGPGAELKLADGASSGKAEHMIFVSGSETNPLTTIKIDGLFLDANIHSQIGHEYPRGLVVEFAEQVVIQDVSIRRPFVGMDIGRGSNGVDVYNSRVYEFTEDGISAGGDANKYPGGRGQNISFFNCRTDNAPLSEGNAWEIEDGATNVLVQDCVVENVGGNGFGIRNHFNGVDDITQNITLSNVEIRDIGGKYGIYSHCASPDIYPTNHLSDVSLNDVDCEANVLVYGPMEGLRFNGGSYREIYLGYDYGPDNSPVVGGLGLPVEDAILDGISAQHIKINAVSGNFEINNAFVDAQNSSSPYGIHVWGGGPENVTISGTTVVNAQVADIFWEEVPSVVGGPIDMHYYDTNAGQYKYIAQLGGSTTSYNDVAGDAVDACRSYASRNDGGLDMIYYDGNVGYYKVMEQVAGSTVNYSAVRSDPANSYKCYAVRDDGGVDVIFYDGNQGQWRDTSRLAGTTTTYLPDISHDNNLALRFYTIGTGGGTDMFYYDANVGYWKTMANVAGSTTIYQAVEADGGNGVRWYCAGENGDIDMFYYDANAGQYKSRSLSDLTGDMLNTYVALAAEMAASDPSLRIYGARDDGGVDRIYYDLNASQWKVTFNLFGSTSTYLDITADEEDDYRLFGTRDDGGYDMLYYDQNTGQYKVLYRPDGSTTLYSAIDASSEAMRSFTVQIVPELELLEGDANGDGVVSAGDYASVQAQFGNTGEPGIPGDANGDGVVSAGDYASVQANFGNVAPEASSVPEPATMSLLLAGSVLAVVRRRKK